MAANTNKRIPLKHIRDRAKSRYPTKVECAICETTEELELHHYTGLTNLLEKWQKETGTLLDTDEQVIAVRDEFIAEHEYELFEAVVCLCATHHKNLHRVYGKSPPLSTAKKQERWVQMQKDKHNGIRTELQGNEPTKMDREVKSSSGTDIQSGGLFSRFLSSSRPLSSF